MHGHNILLGHWGKMLLGAYVFYQPFGQNESECLRYQWMYLHRKSPLSDIVAGQSRKNLVNLQPLKARLISPLWYRNMTLSLKRDQTVLQCLHKIVLNVLILLYNNWPNKLSLTIVRSIQPKIDILHKSTGYTILFICGLGAQASCLFLNIV